jgi:hypothetical protein
MPLFRSRQNIHRAERRLVGRFYAAMALIALAYGLAVLFSSLFR